MNEELTLKQIKELKIKLESEILTLIGEFEHNTGLTVTQVNLSHVGIMGKNQQFTHIVEIPLRIS